ncbi:MAG: TIGR01906 family membrane protein [Lachnospiraceae bacterium]
MNRKENWRTCGNNLAIGVLFLIFFISLGLAIALYVRPLYYIGMERISEETGYSVEEIKENYDALIDWCSPFAKGELSFPTLPASESGISHFEEVKVIFNLFFALLCVTPFFLAGLIYLQENRKSFSYLLISPIVMCVLPLIVAVASAVDFNRIFVLFHEIVFRNDDWLFSYTEDPIILFLPERFFMQCALIIVATVLLGAAALLCLYFYRKKRRAKSDLPPQ